MMGVQNMVLGFGKATPRKWEEKVYLLLNLTEKITTN